MNQTQHQTTLADLFQAVSDLAKREGKTKRAKVFQREAEALKREALKWEDEVVAENEQWLNTLL